MHIYKRKNMFMIASLIIFEYYLSEEEEGGKILFDWFFEKNKIWLDWVKFHFFQNINQKAEFDEIKFNKIQPATLSKNSFILTQPCYLAVAVAQRNSTHLVTVRL